MYRTIKNTMQILRQQDADTDITEYQLRVLAKSGQIKVLNAGSKYLINMKDSFEFLDMNIEYEKEIKRNEKIL